VFSKAEVCAANMGDLLVYGFANAQLKILLDTHDKLISKMQSYISVLLRIAEIRYQQLAKENKVDPVRNHWIPHFRQIYYIYHNITSVAARCVECVETMRKKANSLTLEDRFQKVQTSTRDFLSAADGFTYHLHGVFGLPYVDIMNQNILITQGASADAPPVYSLQPIELDGKSQRTATVAQPREECLAQSGAFVESLSDSSSSRPESEKLARRAKRITAAEGHA